MGALNSRPRTLSRNCARRARLSSAVPTGTLRNPARTAELLTVSSANVKLGLSRCSRWVMCCDMHGIVPRARKEVFGPTTARCCAVCGGQVTGRLLAAAEVSALGLDVGEVFAQLAVFGVAAGGGSGLFCCALGGVGLAVEVLHVVALGLLKPGLLFLAGLGVRPDGALSAGHQALLQLAQAALFLAGGDLPFDALRLGLRRCAVWCGRAGL